MFLKYLLSKQYLENFPKALQKYEGYGSLG